MNYNKILDGLFDQITAYSSVYRKNTQPFTKNKISKHFPDYRYDFDHEIIRESLIEHVGCLPVIATYLHPYMDHKVDLGKALIMLAIHDIGELTVGDEISFLKTKDQDKEEYAAGMEILHDNYKALYTEMDESESNEAKFTKSIDTMAPHIFNYLCGEEYSIRRLKHQVGWTYETAMINLRAKKRPYMEWSPFLTNLIDHLFSRFKSIKEKE